MDTENRMIERPTPEFSRPFAVDRLKKGEMVVEIEADAAEKAALASRFGLIAVDRLAAELRLARVPGDAMIRMSGRLEADVTQSCVITLEPVPSRVEASFSRLYEPREEEVPSEKDVALDPDDDDPPEPVIDAAIDLGEAVAEQLSLELEPFPRASGVVFDGFSCGPAGSADEANPFVVLARLKPNPE